MPVPLADDVDRTGDMIDALETEQALALDRDGYLLLRDAVPALWRDDLRAAFDAGVGTDDQWAAPRGGGWRHSLVDLDPVVRQACRLPALLAVAGRLLGGPFFLSQVEGREPLAENGHQPLHRDGMGRNAVAALIFRKQLLARYGARAGRLSDAARHRYTIATGIVLGTLVTVSSVGAGALGVTALLLLYPRLETARIVGSDIAHAVPLTLVAGAGHMLLGHIDFAMLGSLLVGSLPGITIASSIAPRLPEQALRYALSGVLVLVAVRLLANYRPRLPRMRAARGAGEVAVARSRTGAS